MSPLLYVGVWTFSFVGSLALAAWGDCPPGEIVLAVLLGVGWLDAFFKAWHAAERFHVPEELGRGVCGDCLEIRWLYRNPNGPIALCHFCLSTTSESQRT